MLRLRTFNLELFLLLKINTKPMLSILYPITNPYFIVMLLRIIIRQRRAIVLVVVKMVVLLLIQLKILFKLEIKYKFRQVIIKVIRRLLKPELVVKEVLIQLQQPQQLITHTVMLFNIQRLICYYY